MCFEKMYKDTTLLPFIDQISYQNNFHIHLFEYLYGVFITKLNMAIGALIDVNYLV